MGNLQNYGGFDLDVFDEDTKEIEKSSKSSEYMKLEDGDNVVRFLPPPKNAPWAKRPDGSLSPFKVVHEHFCEVPGLKHKIRFVCPRMHGGGACPACEEADALIRTGNPFDRDKAKELYPTARTYANVIDRNDEGRGPKVLAMSKTIREGLARVRKRFGDFTNPTSEGFDIIIERTDKNNKIEYAVEGDRQGSELGDESWLEMQFNLDTYARVQTLDEIKDLLSGNTGGNRRQMGGGRDSKRLGDGRSGSSSRGGDRESRSGGRDTKQPDREQRQRMTTAADDAIDAEFEDAQLDDALADEDDALPT